MTDAFAPRAAGDVAALVRDHPLAWVVSHGEAGFAATPLPLIAETDDGGAVTALIGHFARPNPQVAMLREDPRALILFQGPSGYISPRWVSQPAWGPTWNYAVARFEVDLRFDEGATDAAIARLAIALEGDDPGAWTPAEMGERYARLAARIIGFRAEVRRSSPRFKLGQDETAGTFDEIVGRLDDSALGRLMRSQRG